MKFLLASLKILISCKSCSESRIIFLLRLSFALIDKFFLIYIHSWFSEQFSESQAVSTTPVANLPPVSTTPAANFSTIFASVVDTGGRFATGVNDTGGKQ
jgi:hypothetical protein